MNISFKSVLNRAVEQLATQSITTAGSAGLYNEKLYAWLNNNQPVFWEDNPQNYVANGFQSNGDVYSCIDFILTKLSYCPILVYTVKAGKEQQASKYKSLRTSDFAKAELYRMQTKALAEIEIPGITKLLNNPNSQQTTSEWLKQLAGFYLLTGNSYNYYAGLAGSKKWSEMWVLPAPLINIVSGGDHRPIKGYNVFNSINFKDNVPDFPAENVSHLKTFNPNFTTYGAQLYGQSPLRAYIMTLVRNKDSRIEQGKQVKNGGVSGMLSPKVNMPAMSSDVKSDLKQQIKEAKTSADLLSRIFISGVPAEWLQFGLPSVELQLLESLSLDRIDICNAFHINPVLMGNMNASTDNNMEWSAKQFIYNCIMTLGNTITDKLTRNICPPYQTSNDKIMLMFDYSVLPELADDMSKIATALSTMFWTTMNEKREFQGFGRSIEPNADKLIIPKNYALLEDIDLTDSTFTNANSNL